MSASVNKVLMIGNLCHDPELKYTPSGAAVCNFSIALNRKFKDKQSGQTNEEVSYIDVACFGKTAELAAEYLKKGRQAHVEGRLKQDRWEDKESGKKRSKLVVVAENITFLGGKDHAGGGEAAPSSEEAFS